jgi:D-alanine-D-alanine ligase
MKIGIAYTLKPDTPAPAGAPDDIYEEFDAPVTVRAIADVLRGLGHDVAMLGDGREFLQKILADAPELVFNFAEGTGVGRSRESRVPAACEMLGIPYTGSDPIALGNALDKELSRRLVEPAGVVVPKGIVLQPPGGDYDGDAAEFAPLLSDAGLNYPVILKPTCEGSSKGVRDRCLIRSAAEFGPTVVRLWRDYQQPVLVEEFIDGLEVTVAILGHDPADIFGTMAVTPKDHRPQFVYSLEVKRDYLKLVDYHVPPPLPLDVLRETEAAALAAFHALALRDVARIDFRVRDGVPYFLEANPLPGMNPESSDLIIMAGLMGRTHADVIGSVLAAAKSRCALK